MLALHRMRQITVPCTASTDCSRRRSVWLLTVDLITGFHLRYGHHRLVELQMGVRQIVQHLSLPHLTPWELWSVDVNLPCIEAEGDGAVCTGLARCGRFEAEEWTEHDVRGGECEERQYAQCALMYTCRG